MQLNTLKTLPLQSKANSLKYILYLFIIEIPQGQFNLYNYVGFFPITWTMLKLSLMYKVWNGLALRHLKVRLTNAMQWWNSEFRVLGLSPEFWVC